MRSIIDVLVVLCLASVVESRLRGDISEERILEERVSSGGMIKLWGQQQQSATLSVKGGAARNGGSKADATTGTSVMYSQGIVVEGTVPEAGTAILTTCPNSYSKILHLQYQESESIVFCSDNSDCSTNNSNGTACCIYPQCVCGVLDDDSDLQCMS
jgi:hypothetical protein